MVLRPKLVTWEKGLDDERVTRSEMNDQGTNHRSISIAPNTRTSFGEEQRELMQRRCKAVYLVGVVIAGLALLFFLIFVSGRASTLNAPFARWRIVILYLHVASFVVAALVVFARSWSMRVLLTIDLTLIAFNILLAHFNAVVFERYTVPIFAVSLLLFLHASLVPVRVSAQAGLAAVGAFGFTIMAALGYTLIPEIQRFWQEAGRAADLRATLLDGTFELSILGIVSVTITTALYHMRLSLHRARQLGSYIIEEELGRGGMGQVYVAEHALMSRPTAVKVLKTPPGEGEAWLARFEREVRLSATLTHPNTITVYDFGRAGRDTFYYAMEYLDGLNLEEFVTRFGPVPPERTVFILTQICGSLAEAHENDVMHRDIKPSNILLTHRGGMYDFVKVFDFGLAKQIEPDDAPKVTKTGILLGTPQYIAPEAATAPDEIDGRADLYGLGGVAYWMLVGRPPFEATTSTGLVLKHMRARPKPPAEASELSVPPELDRIVMRCLEKDPADRFRTAWEVEEALRAIRFDDEWTHERARAWWAVHLPEHIRKRETR